MGRLLEAEWDTLDSFVEDPTVPTRVVVAYGNAMLLLDPDGARRRAQGPPQYDLGRAQGGEHEPVPDGGGDSGKPHPEGSTEPEEQPAPEPQAPAEPFWPVDPSYTRPDTEPASPEDFALANDCS